MTPLQRRAMRMRQAEAQEAQKPPAQMAHSPPAEAQQPEAGAPAVPDSRAVEALSPEAQEELEGLEQKKLVLETIKRGVDQLAKDPKRLEPGFVALANQLGQEQIISLAKDLHREVVTAEALGSGDLAQGCVRLVELRRQSQQHAQSAFGQHGRAGLTASNMVVAEDVASMSDKELVDHLAGMFLKHLMQIETTANTSVASFTVSAANYRDEWATRLVDDNALGQLFTKGVVVLEQAIPLELCRQVVAEAVAIDTAGHTTVSSNPCNPGARSLWFNIREDDTSSKGIQAAGALRQVTSLLAAIPDRVNGAAATSPGQFPELRIHEHAFFSVYEEGVQYHDHLDSYGGNDNSRMLTVIAYLNEDWQQGMGGELRVYKSGDDKSDYVDLAPVAGRVVMFKSHDIHHAVLPANFKRFCIQIWSHGEFPKSSAN